MTSARMLYTFLLAFITPTCMDAARIDALNVNNITKSDLKFDRLKDQLDAGRCSDDNAPAEFDAREHFKDKKTGKSCIHPPLCYGKDLKQTLISFSVDTVGTKCFLKGQGSCNNCYAHAVSGMVSDRMCISEWKSGQSITKELLMQSLMSPQDLTSCGGGNGCESGEITNSVKVGTQHLVDYGIVSYDCMPYWSWEGVTGKCPHYCRNGQKKTHYKARKYEDISRSRRAQPKCMIMEDGPLAAGFSFPPDFKPFLFGKFACNERSGEEKQKCLQFPTLGLGNNGQGNVYIPNQDWGMGGTAHAVKIIGWGWQEQYVEFVDAVVQVPYWLCQNSWGPDPASATMADGRAPYFKLVRETEAKELRIMPNEATLGIEGSLYSVQGPYTKVDSDNGAVGATPDPSTLYHFDGSPVTSDILRDVAEAICAYYGAGELKDDYGIGFGCKDLLNSRQVKMLYGQGETKPSLTNSAIQEICFGYGVGCTGTKADMIAQLVQRLGYNPPLKYNLGQSSNAEDIEMTDA